MVFGREVTDSAAEGTLFVGGSVAVVLVAGVLIGFPWQVVLLVAAFTVVVCVVIVMQTYAQRRRDTLAWQDAAVTVTSWAKRHAGRCETTASGFGGDTADEWTLPASPRFAGTILALGRCQGFEVGIACWEEPETDSPNTRHSAFLVRLPEAHQFVRLTPWQLRRRSRRPAAAGVADAAAARLAALPKRVERVEIQDRELCVVYHGWPGTIDVDSRVEANVDVARALHPECT